MKKTIDVKPALRLLRAMLREELAAERHGFSHDEGLVRRLKVAIKKLGGK